MLSAIDFDDQTRGKTDEVHDVIAESILPPEAQAVDLLAAEVMPELLFRIDGVLAKLLDDRIGRHLRLPLPLTPPAGGGGFPLSLDSMPASPNRSEDRRVGKACVRTCISGWS